MRTGKGGFGMMPKPGFGRRMAVQQPKPGMNPGGYGRPLPSSMGGMTAGPENVAPQGPPVLPRPEPALPVDQAPNPYAGMTGEQIFARMFQRR